MTALGLRLQWERFFRGLCASNGWRQPQGTAQVLGVGRPVREGVQAPSLFQSCFLMEAWAAASLPGRVQYGAGSPLVSQILDS